MKKYALLIITLLILMNTAQADDTRWLTGTLDNDLFVGNDSGYTNGLYLSYFKIHSNPSTPMNPDFMVKPLLWLLPKKKPVQLLISILLGKQWAPLAILL